MGERAADGDRPPSFSLTPLESVLVGIRLRGERLGGVDDIHFHPAEPRTFRLTLTHRF